MSVDKIIVRKLIMKRQQNNYENTENRDIKSGKG